MCFGEVCFGQWSDLVYSPGRCGAVGATMAGGITDTGEPYSAFVSMLLWRKDTPRCSCSRCWLHVHLHRTGLPFMSFTRIHFCTFALHVPLWKRVWRCLSLQLAETQLPLSQACTSWPRSPGHTVGWYKVSVLLVSDLLNEEAELRQTDHLWQLSRHLHTLDLLYLNLLTSAGPQEVSNHSLFRAVASLSSLCSGNFANACPLFHLRLWSRLLQVGLVYMFNLIVGTGALTMPRAFATAGWVVSLALITFLGFMRYPGVAIQRAHIEIQP